ncbi:MAG: type II toxin-antitoxin system RelE/ParE family toxin [Deltaproteobacteria bacterium]|nr:type II toxin-antitoxin system RelE/ParE family toxin [Deltaproteobacteria bacterium]
MGAQYNIQFKPSVFKQLKQISSRDQKKIMRKIQELEENPRPFGLKKLVAEENLYRIRVGDYRIIYQIQDKILLILVIKIGHRKDIYR